MRERELVKECDIAIIGAGPAGVTTAIYLNPEYKVILLDQSRFPRDKACGGLLVPEAQSFLNDMKIPDWVFSCPRHLNIRHVDWDNDKEVQEPSPRILNVSRKDFDHWLSTQILERVVFLTEAKFLNHSEENGMIRILAETHGDRMTILARYLIGADGALSHVRKSLGNKQIRHWVAIQQWIENGSCHVDSLLFIYDNQITDFYSWVIPKRDHLIIGSALKPGDTEKKMELLINKVKNSLGISGTFVKREAGIGLRPQTINDISLGDDRILLVGEAAGFISPSSGDGISFALRSGYNCALALNEDFSGAASRYRHLCNPLAKEIKDKIRKSDIISNPVKRKEFLESIR